MRTDVAYQDLAARQGGVVSRTQLLSGLATQRQLERRLETGELMALHEGVYAVRGAPITAERALWAAVLAGGSSAVASRRSAAGIWGLRNIWPAQSPEITVPIDWPLDLAGVVVHRSSRLGPPDVVRLTNGLPVTSPARTLLDIGRAVGPLAQESACIDALHRGLVTHRKLVDVYARIGGKGRPGSAAMRMFLNGSPEGVAAIESELEARLWRLIRQFGLPRPTPQFWVKTPGGNFRLDFAWPEIKAGIELNGKADHDGPLARKRDRRRGNLLKAAGWTVLDYGWGDVVGRPEGVAAQLHGIFGPTSSLVDGLEPKLEDPTSAA